MDRRVFRHQQQVRRLAGECDWREVLARVVAQVRVHDRPDRHVGRMTHDQRVSIGWRLGDEIGGDDAGGN